MPQPRTIPYLPLKELNARHATEMKEAMAEVVNSGWYLRGEQTRRFEQEYAQYIGTRYCVGCGNGLDALTLIFRAYKELGILQEGDEVIVPANTYIASILAITENNLTPILVEPRIDTFQMDDSLIEQHITKKTKAILLVHLYGYCAYTEKIAKLCNNYHLLLIEDNAQAHGCNFQLSIINCHGRLSSRKATGRRVSGNLGQSSKLVGSRCSDNFQLKKTGSLGNAAGHSFYPGKNLGALGDGGAVTTDDEQLAEVVRALGNYGSSKKYHFDYMGKNSRLDELQAALLRIKLKYLDQDNERRRQIALRYIREISNPLLRLPSDEFAKNSVHHIFPVLCEQRDRLQEYLREHGVETIIHYPIPPHQQPCYAAWNTLQLPVTEQIHQQELSIPLHPLLKEEETTTIILLLNQFQ
ncbi:MAG: DegT/DnrJ/EryC1/StrS family aminotransferase [Prevotella sp.]|nr:DegT/DnrJ/EryC1/StrS family aminotransferase [Prevotella sp.]